MAHPLTINDWVEKWPQRCKAWRFLSPKSDLLDWIKMDGLCRYRAFLPRVSFYVRMNKEFRWVLEVTGWGKHQFGPFLNPLDVWLIAEYLGEYADDLRDDEEKWNQRIKTASTEGVLWKPK